MDISENIPPVSFHIKSNEKYSSKLHESQSKVQKLAEQFEAKNQDTLEKAQETEPSTFKIETGTIHNWQPEGRLKRAKEPEPETHVVIEHGIEPQSLTAQGVLRPANLEESITKTTETTETTVAKVQLPKHIQDKIEKNKEDFIELQDLKIRMNLLKEKLKSPLQNKDIMEKIKDEDLRGCLRWTTIKKNSIKNTIELLEINTKNLNDKLNNTYEELKNMKKEYENVMLLIADIRDLYKNVMRLDHAHTNAPASTTAPAPQKVPEQEPYEQELPTRNIKITNNPIQKTDIPRENFAQSRNASKIKRFLKKHPKMEK